MNKTQKILESLIRDEPKFSEFVKDRIEVDEEEIDELLREFSEIYKNSEPVTYVKEVLEQLCELAEAYSNGEISSVDLIAELHDNADPIFASIFFAIKPEFRKYFDRLIRMVVGVAGKRKP